MLGRKRRFPRTSAERNWFGYTPCGLLVFSGANLSRSGLGQKMLPAAGCAATGQNADRLELKPESVSGERIVLVMVAGSLTGKDLTTPCLPRSRISPPPPGRNSAKNWVTKTRSSASFLPLLVTAMAVGLPPTVTVPVTVRFLVSMIETVPSV